MLKATIDKAEFDALPETVRAHYKESGGKFLLDLQGAVLETDHAALKTTAAEFRDNNVALMKALGVTTGPADAIKKAGELSAAATRLAAIEPEHATLKAAADALKGKGVEKPDDLDQKIAAAVKAAVDPLTTQLTTERTAREQAQREGAAASFKQAVGAAATEAGVDPRYLRHVVREAEGVFEWRDGGLMPRDGVKNPVDPLKPLAPTDWLTGLKTSDPAFFKPSTGAGADNGAGGGGTPAVKTIQPNAVEIGRMAADIASGKVAVAVG